MKKSANREVYSPEKKASEDKKNSRKFLGGLALISYFLAFLDYFDSHPGNSARGSFQLLEHLFGPNFFFILCLCFGTFCLFLLLVNERN